MSDDNTQGGAEPSLASAGSHGSASRWNGVPVAWAAVGQNGVPLWLAYHRQDAEGAVVGAAQVVPLYRAPTLTAAELELLRRLGPSVYANACYMVTVSADERKTLAGLLARLGGGA